MSGKNEVPVVYFVERGLYKARVNHLTKLAAKSNLVDYRKDFSSDVSHVIAQELSRQQALEYLRKVTKVKQITDEESMQFVTVDWFVSCMKEKRIVTLTEEHRLKSDSGGSCPPTKRMKVKEERTIPMYACQRSTPLKHANKLFTDALEVLEEHAMFRGDANAESRSLAFHRGSATLKCLPARISWEDELRNLPHIDVGNSSKPGHCKRVILDILSYGQSSEVEEILRSDFYKSMKVFTGIFGVGPQTARKWFHDFKLRTLKDVKNSSSVHLNKDQRFGLEYYDDLNRPLPVGEARNFETLIRQYAEEIQPDIEINLVGGFRRGKPMGHDMDLLITHKEDGKEKILHKLLHKLQDRIIYSDKKAGSVNQPYSARPGSTMDHFEKCYGIFKIDTVKGDGSWTARRVDLIVVPYSQFAFALLGWSGSRHFEREIRRYAKSEKQMVLTSHGLYSSDGTSHPASSEEEIFDLLGLKYQKPCDRNC